VIQISDLRTLIPDKAKLIPPPQDSPETIGRADGVGTAFYLTRSGLVTGTLTLYSSQDGQTWSQIPSTDYILDPNGQLVTFTNAPAASVYLGARYQVEWFSDAELTTFITNAYQRPYMTDYQFGLHAKLQAISILQTSPDLVLIKHYGDRYDDVAQLMQGWNAQIKQINAELMGNLTPLQSEPAIVIDNGRYHPYVPRR
jgi:hypothetical protein